MATGFLPKEAVSRERALAVIADAIRGRAA
jgi:hypothetical protein